MIEKLRYFASQREYLTKKKEEQGKIHLIRGWLQVINAQKCDSIRDNESKT